MKSVFTEFW